MTPPASHRVCRAPWYSGYPLHKFLISDTGLSPSLAALSKAFSYQELMRDAGPTTPPAKRGFGLFRFRSPLLTESLLISFPPGTEMFQFPGFPPPAMRGVSRINSGMGYPIRTPPVDSACLGTHRRFRALARVLHRPKLPRHPPLALALSYLSKRPLPIFKRTLWT